MFISLLLLTKKNTFLTFSVIFGMYSNNNREALTLRKCVNNGTSARVTSSAGIFLTSLLPMGNSSSKNARSAHEFYARTGAG